MISSSQIRDGLNGGFDTAQEVAAEKALEYNVPGTVADNYDTVLEIQNNATDAYTSAEAPGFGVAISLAALAGAAGLALWRNRSGSNSAEYTGPDPEDEGYRE